MNRRFFLKQIAGYAASSGLSPLFLSCRKECCCVDEKYSVADFLKVPKIDVHVHYDILDDAYLTYANSIGMHIVSINTDYDISPFDKQLDIVCTLQKQHPDMISFLGTFSVDDFGKDGFIEQIIDRIGWCMNAGAKGIKIWKNIGMTLQDKRGNCVMADNPAFAPVFAYLEKQGIPLMAHLGDPKNCWLPYDEMTTKGDMHYYQQNPQYHMYQHPEKPSYEQQILARDHLLERYPKLPFVGAHIGSLEWNLDEVAKRFDAYPNFTVDVAARIPYLQLHSFYNRKNLQSFLTKYQERFLFGSDVAFREMSVLDKTKEWQKRLYETWLEQWKFLATDNMVPSDYFMLESIPKKTKGLHLPRTIVDKIFYENAKRIFSI